MMNNISGTVITAANSSAYVTDSATIGIILDRSVITAPHRNVMIPLTDLLVSRSFA
jgi:hypothetical protein